MPDQLDLNIRPSESDEPIGGPRARPPAGPIIVIALLVVAAAIAAYFAFFREASAPVDQAAAPPPASREAPAGPLGGTPQPVEVPPLDESDAVVRTLVGQLSSHPRVAAWLTTDGLIRNFTTVVTNIAEGPTPTVHLQRLRPSGRFEVVERGDELMVDERSYERYDSLADAVQSVDAEGAARLYATLKPRIEEAYRDLGFPDTPFDRTLERAITSLLATPVTDGPVAVVPRGIGYGYADPKLESLTAAQTQLLRMGPRNARTVQRKLREIALALGVPEARLPAGR